MIDSKRITKQAMIWLRQHWWLWVVILGIQYLTGNWLSEPSEIGFLSYDLVLLVHKTLAKLIIVFLGFSVLMKMYFWYLRRK